MTPRDRLLRAPAALLLLALALVTRVALPPGMMPGAGGLVLCSGMGPIPGPARMTAMPGMGQETPAQGDHPGPMPSKTECPFAAAAVAPLIATAPQIAVRLAVVGYALIGLSRSASVGRLARLRPPTRAPPPTLVPTTLTA